MDKDGDGPLTCSALQKSIRGSDVDAHYAARLIEAGDLLSLARRLIVIAMRIWSGQSRCADSYRDSVTSS